MLRPIKEHERDLLKFNYEKLNQSVWENHKISWIVTSIFLTAIFGFQTFIIKDYFSDKGRNWPEVFIAVLIIEGLGYIWFQIMKCFRSYNRIRFKRLKEIEDILSREMIEENIPLVRQYDYRYRCKDEKEEGQEQYDFIYIYKQAFKIISFLNLILLAYAILLQILKMFIIMPRNL